MLSWPIPGDSISGRRARLATYWSCTLCIYLRSTSVHLWAGSRLKVRCFMVVIGNRRRSVIKGRQGSIGDGLCELQIKLQVEFDDLWDWAYCPLRVWWRKRGTDEEAGLPASRRTGEQLMRRALQVAIEMYYQIAQRDKPLGIAPPKALGLVWRTWLEGWGFDGTMSKDLVAYQEGRRAILRRFEQGGDIRRPDGSTYRRPMWTRRWHELAVASGLLELRKHIDGQCGRDDKKQGKETE